MARKIKPFHVFIAVLGAVGALILAGIVGLAVVIFVFTYPTNDRDNANLEKRKEMASITLEWGRLAPFPPTAKNFTIKTEANMFTRTFVGSFSDDPATIRAWLEKSPGFTEGETDGNIRELKTGEGVSYGTIEVSPDGSFVAFRVSWS